MIVWYVIVTLWTLFVWFKGSKITLFNFGHFRPLLATFGHFWPLLAGRPAKTPFGRLFSNPASSWTINHLVSYIACYWFFLLLSVQWTVFMSLWNLSQFAAVAFEKPAPRKTKQEAVATILHLHGGDFLEGKKKYISNIIFNIEHSFVCESTPIISNVRSCKAQWGQAQVRPSDFQKGR